MSLKKQFSAFYSWLDQRKRAAWKPKVAKREGLPTDSKFSGIPYLPDGQWPKCGLCAGPLQLFLQLNLSQLPADAPNFGQGLIQFFFCTNEDASCYADCYGDPYAQCQCLRLVQLAQPAPAIQLPIFAKTMQTKQIVGWTHFEEFPNDPERKVMGMEFGGDDVLRIPKQSLELEVEFEDDYYDWSNKLTFQGNKLSGWPAWVQNIEYVDCPICKQRMNNMVFQIAHDKNLTFMLGDGGIGQILQCREHPAQLAFVWASS